jgi:hypothetical protein
MGPALVGRARSAIFHHGQSVKAPFPAMAEIGEIMLRDTNDLVVLEFFLR